ncbi:MAG: hypothetical protein A2255_00930 [Candidatus Melainabacteria bacterium RIFOXYA2_FULL_32_9]|nr:MAG: hypothetical protein A2255_00930 [Candidatus Melainabacteria bacterium RIFOXYA2_FULL_32_9]
MTLKLDKNDLKCWDSISVTAYRIISIFNMLVEAPYSDKEINERLQQDIIGARSLSQDTICIYINTLRALGCTISRPSKNNDYKYALKSHPFKLKLDDEEIFTLVEIRKYISTLDDWRLMINVDNLYNAILEYLDPEDKKKFTQTMKDCLRDIEITHKTQLISLLEKYCSKKRTLMVNYLSPETGEKTIEITADKLSYENGAFYLWGSLAQDEIIYLRVDRIKEINAINIKNSRYTPQVYCVRYKLTGFQALMFTPNEDESIIEKSDKEIIVEAKIQNKFKFIQRALAYGSDCTVMSPENIRKEIVTKLKSIYNSYKHTDIVN